MRRKPLEWEVAWEAWITRSSINMLDSVEAASLLRLTPSSFILIQTEFSNFSLLYSFFSSMVLEAEHECNHSERG